MPGYILLTLVLFLGCRKNEDLPFNPKVSQSSAEQKFFNENLSSNAIINGVTRYVQNQNVRYRFVNDFVHYAGYAIWNKSRILSRSGSAGRTFESDDTSLVFTPLLRVDSAEVAAILVTKITSRDTSHKVVYDWQYRLYGSVGSDRLAAHEIFTLFALLNNDVFDYTEFEILDYRLLPDAVRFTLDNFSLDFDSVGVIYTLPTNRNDNFDHELCTSFEVCIRHCLPFREANVESSCCITTLNVQECLSIWPIDLSIWDPGDPHEGGGGGGWSDPCDPLTFRSLPCNGVGWVVIPPCTNGVIVGGMCYTMNNFPGKDDGFPFLWWEDDSWLAANFSLDTYDQYRELTQAEKNLVHGYPDKAHKLWKNRRIAEDATIAIFGINGRNDKSDAFRHAYFQAINCLVVNPAIVSMFANAHETEVPLPLALEKQMDLFNNQIGLNLYAGQNWAPTSVALIGPMQLLLQDIVMAMLTSGQLVYLSPLDLQLSPDYDNNPRDGIQDCAWCANGIYYNSVTGAPVTQITPTNQ